MKYLATFSATGKLPRRDGRTREPAPADPTVALRRLLPPPLAEVGTIMAAIGVKRSAAQAALTSGLRSGELRLAHRDDDGVMVVAEEGAA